MSPTALRNIQANYYLNNALNSVAEHPTDSMLLAPCFPAVERPFFPTNENNNRLQFLEAILE